MDREQERLHKLIGTYKDRFDLKKDINISKFSKYARKLSKDLADISSIIDMTVAELASTSAAEVILKLIPYLKCAQLACNFESDFFKSLSNYEFDTSDHDDIEKYITWSAIMYRADQAGQLAKKEFSDFQRLAFDGYADSTVLSAFLKEDLNILIKVHIPLIKLLIAEYDSYIPNESYGNLEQLNTQLNRVTTEEIDKIFKDIELKSKPEAINNAKPSIFISYNRSDEDIAEALKNALIKESEGGINVIFDKDTMRSGNKIEDFIHQSVSKANVTLSIISEKSLMSYWVAAESIATFYKENLNNNNQFIACFADQKLKDRFYDSFTSVQISIADELNKKIGTLDKDIDKLRKIGQSFETASRENKRLIKLRDNLDDIISKLYEYKTENVLDETNFNASVKNIIETLT